MHFSIEQVLWAILLAAHLTLLVVLIGRDRAARFRWFTAYITLGALALMANHLLHGKLTTVAFYWQNYSLLTLQSIVALFMLNELARQTLLTGKTAVVLKPKAYVGWGAILVALTAAAVWAWGPWPSMEALQSNPTQLRLLMIVLIGMKGQLGTMILTVLLALVLRFVGTRFGAGWRSHPQQILLGLSTSALAFLAVQAVNDVLSHTLHPKSRQEYDHAVRLITHMENARTVVWTLALLWILYWVWREEPGAPAQAALTEAPAGEGTIVVEGSAARALPGTLQRPLEEDSLDSGA